jgi:ABC-type cobalamin/Fe3+-siderophores transport system ATPase subunit
MQGDQRSSEQTDDQPAAEAAKLYHLADRYRRLARSISDQQTQKALCALALETEAKADRLTRHEPFGPTDPPSTSAEPERPPDPDEAGP